MSDDIRAKLLQRARQHWHMDYAFADQLMDAVRAVLDLHVLTEWPGMDIPGIKKRDICGECSDEDFIDYPCPTVRAITEAIQ